MSEDPTTHETRTDPVGLAAAAHRQRMAMLADGAPDTEWHDDTEAVAG